MPSSEYKNSTKSDREAALGGLVRTHTSVGILGYIRDEPLAWCSIAPRHTYAALQRSRTIPQLDDATDTWAVVCFFIDSKVRRQGSTLALLEAAVDYARASGARSVEGYPWPGGPSYLYMGTPETFRNAGFHEAVPPGPKTRRVMHYVMP